MIEYSFSAKNAHNHFLTIQIKCDSIQSSKTMIQLPAWRPGRYELGNFAKNVRDFSVVDENGNDLSFKKATKDKWEIETTGIDSFIVTYDYYANELNAGSTYLDEIQMYANPVNCCAYIVGRENELCRINLQLPEDYIVATGMKLVSKHVFECKNFDELADSPFIASNALQHFTYKVENIQFHCWFQGEVKVDEKKLITDFHKFSQFQIEKMGSLPVDDYHFLFQILPVSGYHGVEHLNSTVILLGPSYSIFGSRYVDLLGISSHELFHSWNIKAIRPSEMFPYDFTKENYSELGYVAEGVTTYLGDRFLYESGVYSRKEYQTELINYLKKHYHNDGRNHYDVASSSFDTWLDGYAMGIPGRKVSIYTEGMMIAYICDMRIRKQTNRKSDIYTVMKKLYERTNQKTGYTEELYKQLLEEVAGCSFDDIFNDLVHGVSNYEKYLSEAMEFDGLKLIKKKNPIEPENYGIRGVEGVDGFEVLQVIENSSAYKSGIVEGDKIIEINGITPSSDFANWLTYFNNDKLNIIVNRKSKRVNVCLDSPNENFYVELEIKDIE